MNELPITVIITSRSCRHCIDFRGEVGKPINDKAWSPKLIKKLLTGESNPTLNSSYRSGMVIEIHLSNMNIPSDNIIQVNEYNLVTIGNKVALRRIIFTRRKDDKITYDVEIDGISNPEEAQRQKGVYWGYQLPKQLSSLYLGDVSVLKQDPSNDLVKSVFDSVQKSFPGITAPSEEFFSFINNLYDNIFTFKYWLANNIPIQIENLVSAFPSWIFVSPREWRKSIVDNSPLYGVVNSSIVTKNRDGTYSSERSSDEDPIETLNKILNGTYSIYPMNNLLI